ncbi:gas vesicle protein [Pedococcus sp. 5OH_020]|uniref:gas vesicle protein n=1 Tax=Pedococcus sp. 5OH_020 TaxID=2989814 RepID=UPI0022E9E862|nr:gas vesicle protein [Pedococcus sp. 5OH_020]
MSVQPFPGSREDVALVDLLDRVIDGGVVVTGDIVLSVADVDLVYVGLRLVLAPAYAVDESIRRGRSRRPAPGP